MNLSPHKGTLLARGREAEVWDLGDGTVLKLYYDATTHGRAAHDAAVLVALRAAGVNVPAVLAEMTVEMRPGILLEHVAGPDLLAAMGRRPWLVLSAGRTLARTQLELNGLRAPLLLPSMTTRLGAPLSTSPHFSESERASLLELLGAQQDGDRICHGDLHLENLMVSKRSAVAIDWSNASAGPPIADVARTLVILRFGEPPPGAPAVVRRLTPALRRSVISQYLRTHRSARRRPLNGLDAWQVLHAAGRLGETTDSETARIRSWLESAFLV